MAEAPALGRSADQPQVGLERLLAELRRFDALRDQAAGRKHADRIETGHLPGRPPAWAPPEVLEDLAVPVRRALADKGIGRLYRHQYEAIQAVRSGEDVVLVAPTAAGKTLGFAIPVLEGLAADRDSYALLLHPTKALSRDQRRQFETLASEVSRHGFRKVETWPYDGDTPAHERKVLRESPPALILTNPEMLHMSFLGHSGLWRGLLTGLRYLILDEMHEYRGFFGSNVALLLRRFLAKVEDLGGRPQLILASATCANPLEHARNLTGRSCRLVQADTAMRPGRTFVFVEPDIRQDRFYRVYRLRIARAALACASLGLSGLVFCPSRRFAEEVADLARREAEELGVDPECLVPYRSGLSRDFREDVEEGLREGRIRVAFCTNALELGVDIGRLDFVLLAGFPDNLMSVWQRVGRAGRHWQREAFVLYYALDTPFDRFYARNLSSFLDKPLDELIVGVDNEELMGRHMPFLLRELGRVPEERDEAVLGEPWVRYVRSRCRGARVDGKARLNYTRLGMRGALGSIYKLRCNGEEIGTISEHHRFREAYLGAIYRHGGRSYEVVSHGSTDVCLVPAPAHRRTEGQFFTQVHVEEVLEGAAHGDPEDAWPLRALRGRIVLFENFLGYQLLDSCNDDVLEENLGSPDSRRLPVRGFWLELSGAWVEGGGGEREDVHGLEQLLRIAAPFQIACDRHDMATCTETRETCRVFLHETVPGGIGLAERALAGWREILQKGMEMARNCQCRDGCPYCILPPRRGGRNGVTLRKEAAIALAERVLKLSRGPAAASWDPDIGGWREAPEGRR